MGWRLSILIVDKKYEKPFTQLTKEIGLGESEVVGKEKMEYYLYAFHPEIRVGIYQDKTIILYNKFIDLFFKEKPSQLEKRICKVFNDCQMLLQVYHENGCVRGFSLINNGQRVRTKFVEDYQGTLLDVGLKLQEEKKKKFLDIWFWIPRKILGKLIVNANMNVYSGLQNTEVTILKLKEKQK